MAKSFQTRSILLRGLYGAFLGAVVGAVAPVAVTFGGEACWWYVWGSSKFDRAYDRYGHLPSIPHLVFVGAIVFACAGGATLAPRGNYRFVQTLAAIVGIALPIVYIVVWSAEALELTPFRGKGNDHPEWYPSEIALVTVCLVIPIVVAAALTLVRIHNDSKSEK